MENLPPEALPEVADYFQALSEPTRLQLLNVLLDGERNVGGLAQLCGTSEAMAIPRAATCLAGLLVLQVRTWRWHRTHQHVECHPAVALACRAGLKSGLGPKAAAPPTLASAAAAGSRRCAP